MSILQTAIGEGLPPLVKPPITQEQLRYYANASGDHNPVNLDEEATRRVGLNSVIAHGMLNMAFLGQFISHHLGDTPDAFISQLEVRFHKMVHLGDVLTCHGIVMARDAFENGSQSASIECWILNQKGEKVTIGEATVTIPLQIIPS